VPSGPMGAGAMLWQTEKTFQVGNSWRNYISLVNGPGPDMVGPRSLWSALPGGSR